MGQKRKNITSALLVLAITAGVIFSIPKIFSFSISWQPDVTKVSEVAQFPVTVDPINKRIVENTEINEFLEGPTSPLQASANNVSKTLWDIFRWTAIVIADSSWYQSVASVESHFVVITAGMRKEQVVAAFAKELKWNGEDKLVFTTPDENSSLPLDEGSFISGTYHVDSTATPLDAQRLINKRFTDNVLSRYGTSTASVVPLDQALIIASIIQRETIGNDDMRLISGIIWNRLFADMKLQVDATLQYAKASAKPAGGWWPKVVPNDKFRRSPYNTYLNKGLPPDPIASPSVGAILAALNPIKTSCLYYFNDNKGEFHCSDTYEEHVASLKKVYGKGK